MINQLSIALTFLNNYLKYKENLSCEINKTDQTLAKNVDIDPNSSKKLIDKTSTSYKSGNLSVFILRSKREA